MAQTRPAPVSQNLWLVKNPTVQHAALFCALPRQSWRMLVSNKVGLKPSMSPASPSEEGQSLGWAGSAWCPGCYGRPVNWLLAQCVWGCPVHGAALPGTTSHFSGAPTLLPPLSLAGPGQPVPGARAGLPAAHFTDFDVPAGHNLQQHQHPPGPHGNCHFPHPPGVASPGAGEKQTGWAVWEQPRSPAAPAWPGRGWASRPVAGRRALGRRCWTCKGCCLLIY